MNQKGQSLLEVLIATALIGMVVVGLMGGVVVGILGTNSVDQGTTATNIARSQMEFVKSQEGYQPDLSNYPLISEIPAGYSVAVSGVEITPGYLQKITVTVFDSDGQSLFTLEGYKTNR